MNRRSLLQGIAAIGGSLFIGKTETKQVAASGTTGRFHVETSVNGDIVLPGFFTVFIDGKECFRMNIGDTITAERTCHIVAFLGFETLPSKNFYMFEGDTLTITD